jgi:hypothetical protein
VTQALGRCRKAVRPTTLALAMLVVGSIAVGVSSASRSSSRPRAFARMASGPVPPQTVMARSLVCRHSANCLRPGTSVRSTDLGVRVFVNATRGFALANISGVTYPAASLDGGMTWQVAGPQFHIPAANGPAVVTQVGARSPKTYFAWGGPDGGSTVDVSTDGGKHWWVTYLGGVVMSVVGSGDGRLIAITQASSGAARKATNWVFVSKDGGRVWHYNNRLGAR